MPNNALIPYFIDADNVTATASAGVTGKTFVAISGSQQTDLTLTVATCAANAKVFGVAEYDAATGAQLGVVRSGIVPVTCGAAGLAAGVEVMSDAAGLAVVWDGVLAHRPAGVTVSAAIPGADTPIALYR